MAVYLLYFHLRSSFAQYSKLNSNAVFTHWVLRQLTYIFSDGKNMTKNITDRVQEQKSFSSETWAETRLFYKPQLKRQT